MTPCAAQDRPCDPSAPLGPSHDLYCIELIAAPGISGVSGRIEFVLPSSPFTVGLTTDGRTRYVPIASLAGLASGPVYIAWATPPQMDTVIKLGQVRNGRVQLPAIDLEKFIVLITAERTARVRVPGGRIVLRGQSPSTRLFPPDLMEFSLGAVGQQASEHADHMHMENSEWPMVPAPQGITMLPSEMALRPAVAPYLPPQDSAAPLARAGERLRLSDGDTLRLEADLVRRTLNGRTYTMYAFNGQYPGPLLEVARGSEITVLFTNHLTQSSTIHWHGIRLDNASDGADNTQAPVAPGASFTYHLRFPDAGIYWYHPHVREDIQQELGLYGNIVVLP